MKKIPRYNFVQVKIGKAQALAGRVEEICELLAELNVLVTSPLPKTRGEFRLVKPGEKGYKTAAYQDHRFGAEFPLIATDDIVVKLAKNEKK